MIQASQARDRGGWGFFCRAVLPSRVGPMFSAGGSRAGSMTSVASRSLPSRLSTSWTVRVTVASPMRARLNTRPASCIFVSFSLRQSLFKELKIPSMLHLSRESRTILAAPSVSGGAMVVSRRQSSGVPSPFHSTSRASTMVRERWAGPSSSRLAADEIDLRCVLL